MFNSFNSKFIFTMQIDLLTIFAHKITNLLTWLFHIIINCWLFQHSFNVFRKNQPVTCYIRKYFHSDHKKFEHNIRCMHYCISTVVNLYPLSLRFRRVCKGINWIRDNSLNLAFEADNLLDRRETFSDVILRKQNPHCHTLFMHWFMYLKYWLSQTIV